MITPHPPFLIPQRVKFRYRLDGYDRDWHDAGTRRQAFYTDLPPGKYSFRVIASNSRRRLERYPRQAGFLRHSRVLPDELVSRPLRGVLSGAAVGGLPVACPAIASSVRDDAGRARRRAHTHCARASRHSAAKLPRSAAPVSKLFPSCCRSARSRRKRSWTARSSRPPRRSPKAGMRCRDCAIRQFKRNDLALAISTLGEELATDSTGHRPAFRVAVEGQSRDLHPILRDEVYKIAAEALRNAFLHAQRKAGRGRNPL